MYVSLSMICEKWVICSVLPLVAVLFSARVLLGDFRRTTDQHVVSLTFCSKTLIFPTVVEVGQRRYGMDVSDGLAAKSSYSILKANTIVNIVCYVRP